MKKIVAIILIVLLSFECVACSRPMNNTKPTDAPVTESTPISTEASAKAVLTVADLAAVLSEILANDTEYGNWTVDYTEDSIIINFSMEGLDSVVDAMSADYDTYIGHWNSFVDDKTFTPLYDEVKGSIEQFGFNNINIIQNVLSDDGSRVYATYINNKLTYNIADEVPGANVQWYAAGMYKVGVDIPAGEYFIQKEGTLSAYMAVYSDSTGDSILENENFNTFHFITVEDGQYLEVSRGKLTSVDNVSLTYDPQNLTEGMYRVGIDIPAGEYRLECTSSYSGYVCVYPTSRSDRRIKTNDNFENNKYITVSDGEYLLLSRCVGSIVE